MSETTCPKCKGSGSKFSIEFDKDFCPVCFGDGTINRWGWAWYYTLRYVIPLGLLVLAVKLAYWILFK